jgi:hypothetical protein
MYTKSEKMTLFFTLFLGLISLVATTNGYAQTPNNGSTTSPNEGTNTVSMNGMSEGSQSFSNPHADNFTGSISIFQPIINGFKASIHTSLSDAISTAEQSVGDNATTLAAFIHPEKEFIVYDVFAIDSNNIPHKVVVDPGNGNILSTQQMSFMEMMMTLHGGSFGNGMMGPQGMGMMDHGMMGPQGMGMMDHGMMGPQGMGKDYSWP